MLLFLLTLLLISNAINLKQDKSILYSIIVIKALILITFIAYDNVNIGSIVNGIGIYGGLFNVTTFTQSFNILILIVSPIILTITSFFAIKFYLEQLSGLFYILFDNIYYNKNIYNIITCMYGMFYIHIFTSNEWLNLISLRNIKFITWKTLHLL